MSKRSEEFQKIFENISLITPEFYDYLDKGGFFTQVASTKYHGVYDGGLYDHSKNVMNMLLEFTKNENIKWERKESPYIIGMFHDLCKMDNYIKESDGKYIFNTATKGLGHGDRSVELLEKYINLTEEEKKCITFHMGAYETYRWNDFDKAIKMYPNVLWTHMADMYASKVLEEE